MGIKYKLVPRKDFSKDAPEDAIKYFAQAAANGTVSFDEICSDVAEETAQTSADVKGVVDRLTRHLRKHLEAGRNVQVGDLGSFRMAIASKGAADVASFNAATMMKGAKVVYTPGKALQEMRARVTYERVKTKDEETDGGSEDDRPVIE